MSRIEEMIAEMCPDGVEYYALKDVVNINRGKRVTKKELSDDAPYIAYHGSKDTPLGRYHKSNAPEDTTIVVNTGSVGGVKYCSEAFWCSDGSYWLSSDKFASKFLYYYLQQYEKFFMENKREGGVPTLDKTLLENVQLPLVPIEIQNEIIQVLETFEELEAELEAELEVRRQQYEYYRNLLLSFDKREREKRFIEIFCANHGIDFNCDRDLEWEALKDISDKISTGKSNRADENDDGEYPLYVRSKNVLHSMSYQYDDISIIIPGEGGIGDIFHLTNGKYALHQRCYRVHIKDENVLVKYVLYYMMAYFKDYIFTRAYDGTVSSIRKPMVEEFNVPIPPLPVQCLIVDILDKFSTLTEDITEGLPKELELHRKQYEYYRNCLLSFPRRKGASSSEVA